MADAPARFTTERAKIISLAGLSILPGKRFKKLNLGFTEGFRAFSHRRTGIYYPSVHAMARHLQASGRVTII